MKDRQNPSSAPHSGPEPGNTQSDPAALLRAATGYHQAGDLARAAQAYRAVLAADPANAIACYNLGVIAYQTGTIDQGVEYARQAISLQPDLVMAHFILGLLETARRDLPEAAGAFREAVRLQPDFAEAHFNLGNSLKGQGAVEEATACYQQTLALQAEHVGAMVNLGNAYQEQEKYDSAIEQYRQALSLQPDMAEVHYNLGRMYLRTGDLEAAARSLEKAAALKEEYVDAWFGLGEVHRRLGNHAAAIDSFRQVLARNGDDVEAYVKIGNIYAEQEEHALALTSYQQALSRRPDYAEVHYNMGVILAGQDRDEEAVESLRRALAARPDYREAHLRLGGIYRKQKDYAGAAKHLQRVLADDPDCAEAHYNLGMVLRTQGAYDQAKHHLALACRFNPDHMDVLIGLGLLHAEMGEFSVAEKYYRRALAHEPANAIVYHNLADIHKFAENDPLIEEMQQLAGSSETSSNDRMLLSFALGKALADAGQYGRAFQSLAQGNNLMRQTFSYSMDQTRAFFARVKEIFNASFMAAHAGGGEPDGSPVFILGMPRSGTSLVEQILASHPEVHGAGEINDFGLILRRLAASGQLGDAFRALAADPGPQAAAIGSQYVRKLRAYDAGSRYITDKMPHNFLLIGVIALALPNARIIHCLRDPLDNCLSLYKTHFTEEHHYTYTLEEVGEYYLLYDDLMRHWGQVLPPGRLYRVRYEALIRDQQGETGRLLDYCGLSWADECLFFHRTRRTVLTASVAQVRRPIYADSVKLWRRYEKELQPLREILAPLHGGCGQAR